MMGWMAPLRHLGAKLLSEERLCEGADHLLGRDAVDLLGIDAHEVLTASRHDVSCRRCRAGSAALQASADRRLGVGPIPPAAPAAGNLLDRPGYEKVDEREGQQLISDRALNIKPVVKLALFRLRPLAEFRKRGQS
jgi:hypothetical protein